MMSENTKDALTNWKRKANEMDRKTTLSDHIECVAALEGQSGYEITRYMKLPDRYSQSDTVSAFFTKFGMRNPSPARQLPKLTPLPRRVSREQSRSSSYGTPRSSIPESQGVSTNRKLEGSVRGSSKIDKIRGYEQRGRSLERKGKKKEEKQRRTEAGEYKHSKSTKCKKCAGSHASAQCLRYPFYYKDMCSFCKKNGMELYHPVSLCRFSKSRYVTPSPEKSPVSFNRNKNQNTANTESFFY